MTAVGAKKTGGRAWVFGDNIDTDVLTPGRFMKGPIEAAVPHCLESVDPDFAGKVVPGDFVIAGGNFGLGSSREQAAQVLLTKKPDFTCEFARTNLPIWEENFQARCIDGLRKAGIPAN